MPQEESPLKCRHCNVPWEYDWEYCPECRRNFGGAVYPEQQTSDELGEIDQLITLIRSAFDGTQLEGGTTIHEADLEGCYLKEQDRLDARAKDSETEWSTVPDWKIERFPSVLSFFDVKGWRFYIPAYMIWTLRNWRTTNLIIADSVVWTFDPTMPDFDLPRYSSLSAAQSHAAYRFVKFFCDYSGDEESRHAMDAYWHQFASAQQ
jgi:hypothetical protein